MVKLRIDNKKVSVAENLSVLAAAAVQGTTIPTMCYRDGKPHFTSCMICMVKDGDSGKLIPACSVKVREGMQIITMDDEIRESRKMALDLLLSEHVGDCEAPCQITCPAHMDIPGMNRSLAKGDFLQALEIVRNDIPLPAVFGRVCPAPCEGACRRKQVDDPVSICMLKRYAGDHELVSGEERLPQKNPASGKKVAIIGAGAAGLSAAWYLQIMGHQCDVYDRCEQPGGTLRNEIEADNLPAEVLDAEISKIEKLGTWFYPLTEVDSSQFQKLLKKFDAILVACGDGETGADTYGLEIDDKGVRTGSSDYRTSNEKVFAAGSAIRKSKMAIRALGQGKEAAHSINQFLSGKPVTGEKFRFNSRFGKLQQEELSEYLAESVDRQKIEPSDINVGYTKQQVMDEAERCMNCDCRDLKECTLRTLADEYGASQKRYWSSERNKIQKKYFGKGRLNLASAKSDSGLRLKEAHSKFASGVVIYESNKCIKCGKCVHIAEESKEKYGMSFIGRGFDVVIGVPFDEALENGLEKVAEQVVEECPTGALSFYETD